MGADELTYKCGIWKLSLTAEKLLNSDRLIVSSIENLKKDIENLYPNDKKAQQLVNELLYHYCWKLSDNENS